MRALRQIALGLAAACLGAGLGCGGRPAEDGAAGGVAPRASASVEPSEIRIGDRVALEITVASPPDRRLLPFATPESLSGFEVLAVESLPVERRSDRWLHRTRIELRARDVGSFGWPRTDLTLVGPGEGEAKLFLAHVPLTVRSILPAYPGRSEPFGARPAPERAAPSHSPIGIAMAAGGVATLLGVAVRARLRRRARARVERPPDTDPAWSEALGALDCAGPGAEPAEAAHAMAATLRRYMARRFGVVAGSLTSEELAGKTPPFEVTSRWPSFVSLLLDLDALRFRARRRAGALLADAARIEALRDRARAFIEDSTPPEALR